MMYGANLPSTSCVVPLARDFCSGASPRWFEGLLWFSDTLGEAVHTVDLRGSMTTLPLPGRRPCGLGFRPDGSLLVASSHDRQILRYDGETTTTLVDLSNLGAGELGDLVVDALGRAYVGCGAEAAGFIVQVNPDDTVTIAAEQVNPRGLAIAPDRRLLVADRATRQLLSFGIAQDGRLTQRQVFSTELDGPPGGIAVDASGAVWTAMPLAREFQRIVAGGEVTDRLLMGSRIPIACTLGGQEDSMLFLLSNVGVGDRTQTRLDVTRVGVVT